MATNLVKYTEESLVISLKENDKKAFEHLYDNYSSALYGVIFKILNNEEKAEDVMQEVFLKIWRKINEFDPSRGRLFTWMINIARNSSIDLLRKEKNVFKEDIEDSVGKVDRLLSESKEISHIGIKDLIENLKPERKDLVDLVYFQGYTQEEAAEKLSIPLGTAKSRIRVALQELKNYFEL